MRITYLLMLLSVISSAHPSWGIVSNSVGDIFFVDVLHQNGTLWKVPSGERTPKVVFSGNLHAHTLQIDENDCLYIGVHLWIEGELEGDGHHYIFRYDTQQKVLDTLLFSESYAQINAGNMCLWTQDSSFVYPMDKQLWKGHFCEQQSHLLSSFEFMRISTMTQDSDANLWIADSRKYGGSIWKWTGSKYSLFAKNLVPTAPLNPIFQEKSHWLIYGFIVDHEEIIYTESSSGSLRSVNSSNEIRVLYQSPAHYFPVGVCETDTGYAVLEVGYSPGEGHVGPRVVWI